MMHILLDFQLSEALMSQRHMLELDSLAGRNEYASGIFEQHKITEDQFKDSYNWYRQHPKKLQHIYDLMLDSLTRMEVKYEAASKKERLESQVDSVYHE